MTSTIKIAGAGLAGLSAAFCLAREGFKVSVYEKKSVPGHDILSYTCALRNYIEGKNPLKEFRDFHIPIKALEISPKVIKISPSFEKHIGYRSYYLVDMGQSKESIEQQLYMQCLAECVKFHFNTPLEKADIIATGHVKDETNVFGYGHIYKNLNVDPEATYLIYNNDIAPKGYVFAITKNGQTTMMAVSFDKKEFKTLKERFTKALKTFKPLAKMVNGEEIIAEISGGAYYSKYPYGGLKKGNTLYVGEAAGIQDASRGFGLRYAITSGALAARSIIEEKDYVKIAREYYQDEFLNNLQERSIHDKMTNEEYDKIVAMS
jgi:flavin-dependent dehydrogenase